MKKKEEYLNVVVEFVPWQKSIGKLYSSEWSVDSLQVSGPPKLAGQVAFFSVYYLGTGKARQGKMNLKKGSFPNYDAPLSA